MRRVLAVLLLACCPARAEAQPMLHATVAQSVTVDEDRLWVTEFLDVSPANGASVTLPSNARRFGPPAGVGKAGRGGLRVGAGRMSEVELVDGALMLPEGIPAEGVSAVLDYSIPAAEGSVDYMLRYPVAVQRVQVTVTANVRGLRLGLTGAKPATSRQEQAATWTTGAIREEPVAAGQPIRVTIGNLPAYEPPLYAKGALLLAAHLAGLSVLFLFRKRKPKTVR